MGPAAVVLGVGVQGAAEGAVLALGAQVGVHLPEAGLGGGGLDDAADASGELGGEHRGDSEEYLAADIAFHDVLLAAGGNLMLTAIAGPIAEVITGRHTAGLTPAEPVHEALHNHVEAAAAIVRGDADAAERHVRGYVEAILEEVRSVPE